MKGFTYFCTDKFGHVYDRYSALHTEPTYKFAVVRRGALNEAKAHKSCVTYASRYDLAQKALVSATKPFRHWQTGKVQQDRAEIVEVRAYAGRARTEPRTLADRAEAMGCHELDITDSGLT